MSRNKNQTQFEDYVDSLNFRALGLSNEDIEEYKQKPYNLPDKYWADFNKKKPPIVLGGDERFRGFIFVTILGFSLIISGVVVITILYYVN